MNREQIADLIREEYDPKPSHWKAGERGWNDGAETIADKIMADRPASQKRESQKLSYDPACEDLAAHFLADEPGLCVSEGHRKALAQHIQETVEDWIESHVMDAARSLPQPSNG